MKKSLSGILCASLLLLSVAATRADDTAYDIKFQRANTVGDKFDFTAKLEFSGAMKVEVGGKELQNEVEKGKYEIAAVVETLAIADNGSRSKFHITISKFTAAEGDAPAAEAAPEGTEVDATVAQGVTTFTATKGTLSDAATKALSQIFKEQDAASKTTADDIMGTKDKKKVGDSWPINIKAASEAMGGATMDPEKAKGTVKIEAAKSIDGMNWLEFAQSLDSTDITVPKIGAAKEAKITIKETQLLPVDVKNPSIKSDGTQSMHAIFETEQEGQKIKISMDRDEKATRSAILKK